MRHITRCLSLASAVVLLMSTPAGAQSGGMSLLYNSGPRWRAVRVLVTDPRTKRSTCGPGSTLAEADRAGTPLRSRTCGGGYHCANGISVPAAPGGSCASYEIDTRAGWRLSEMGKTPGWDAEILSGGGGTPMVYRYRNDAAQEPDPCTLREIGTVYEGYRGAAIMDGQIRRNADGSPVTMGQFSHVIATFSIAVPPNEYKPPTCGRAPTAYVTADFHIGYAGPGGAIAQHQLLGVLVYGMRETGLQGQPSSSATLWSGMVHSTPSRLLHGEAIVKLPMMALPQLNGEFKTVRIDYKTLFERYFVPPPGHTLKDAVIIGLDIYSSVRGADVTFKVKNIDIIGYR